MWGQAVQYLDELPAQKVSGPAMMRSHSQESSFGSLLIPE